MHGMYIKMDNSCRSGYKGQGRPRRDNEVTDRGA
jgi:hypothetical protein